MHPFRFPRTLILFCALSIAVPFNSVAQPPGDSASVKARLDEFFGYFKNLDFDHFQAFFSEEVTVFYPPSAKVAERVDGKKNAMDIFNGFFKAVRSSKPGPPYLNLDAQKLRIAVTGDIAVVTFELNDPDALSRRTMLFRKEKGQWMIYHIHASLMPLKKG